MPEYISRQALKGRALERWENEGGRIESIKRARIREQREKDVPEGAATGQPGDPEGTNV